MVGTRVVAAALSSLVLLAAPTSAEGQPDQSVVSVVSDGLAYHDGTRAAEVETSFYPGRFKADHARLGFDALRTVDAGGDTPALQDARSSTPVQRVSVVVSVADPGDLAVEVRGVPAAHMAPQPVAESAQPPAQQTQDGFYWSLPQASPGSYRFSASFTLNASPGAGTRFVPEVVIERRGTAGAAVRQLRRESVPMDGTRIDRLTLMQVSADDGPPDADAPPLTLWHGPTAGDAIGWVGELRLSANGTYDPTKRGAIGARNKLVTDGVAGRYPSGHGSTSFMAWPTTLLGDKATPTLSSDAALAPAWDYSIGTVASGSLAAELYEGDEAQAAVGITYSPRSRAERAGPPTQTAGRLQAQWDGAVEDVVAVGAFSVARGTEPNAAQPEAIVNGDQMAVSPSVFSAVAVRVVASGDVDNRGHRDRLHGETTVIPVPSGYTPVRAITGWGGDQALPLHVDIAFEDDHIAVTPVLEPDEFWLQTAAGSDGVLDWVGYVRIVIESGRPDRMSLPLSIALTHHVPQGGRGDVAVWAPRRAPVVTAMPPGAHRLHVQSEAVLQ